MSRAVRRVPKDWVHPTKPMERMIPGVGLRVVEDHIPMHEHFPYNEEEAREGLRDGWLSGEPPFYDVPVMPQWPESERTHLMMYETTSEGTPISPAFETPEELARWLTDNNASLFASMTATYEQWLNVARDGWAFKTPEELARWLTDKTQAPSKAKAVKCLACADTGTVSYSYEGGQVDEQCPECSVPQHGTNMRKKRETLDDLIRMAVRVQQRLSKEGIELRWNLSWVPISQKPRPEKDKP